MILSPPRNLEETRHSSRELVRRLVDHIRAEGLSVGDRLPSIRQLSETFKVGTNVVRDALMQAQTMGLVKIHPRSGAFVQSLSYAPLVDALTHTLDTSLMQVDHNLFHLLDARRLIEIELAGLAAERKQVEELLPVRQALEAMKQTQDHTEFLRADVRFHLGIAQAAGNPVLANVLQALLGLLQPYLAGLPWSPERRTRTDRSHADIYQALLDGDSDRARAAMREHVSYARESLLHEVQSPTSARRK